MHALTCVNARLRPGFYSALQFGNRAAVDG